MPMDGVLQYFINQITALAYDYRQAKDVSKIFLLKSVISTPSLHF